VYERILQVPYYVLFDRAGDRLQIFRLEEGLYREQSESRLWIAEVQLGLGLWTGTFADWERQWLRWYDSEGCWIPSETERAELSEQRARRAEQRAEALAERLRAAGIDPESLSP
jgi:hypothetical protein